MNKHLHAVACLMLPSPACTSLQVREQHAAELLLLQQQHEAAAEEAQRAAADAAVQAAAAQRQALEAAAAEHEAAVAGLRRRYETEAEGRELQHLAELEAAQEGGDVRPALCRCCAACA